MAALFHLRTYDPIHQQYDHRIYELQCRTAKTATIQCIASTVYGSKDTEIVRGKISQADNIGIKTIIGPGGQRHGRSYRAIGIVEASRLMMTHRHGA